MRFGYKEVFAREAKALAIPSDSRSISDGYAIHTASMLRSAIHNCPEGGWTYKLGSGQQLYVHTRKPGKNYGPDVGDIVTVNNPVGFDDSIGCHTADHLGTIAYRDCVRLATPDDPGYVGTREEWHSVLLIENRLLMRETFIAWTSFLLAVGALLLQAVA